MRPRRTGRNGRPAGLVVADPDLHAWLAGLDKLRTIVSDSVYNELK